MLHPLRLRPPRHARPLPGMRAGGGGARRRYNHGHRGVAMTIAAEQFVTDPDGKRVGVLLDIGEYERILAELEELESIRAYDAVKSAGDEAIPFPEAIQDIE